MKVLLNSNPTSLYLSTYPTVSCSKCSSCILLNYSTTKQRFVLVNNVDNKDFGTFVLQFVDHRNLKFSKSSSSIRHCIKRGLRAIVISRASAAWQLLSNEARWSEHWVCYVQNHWVFFYQKISPFDADSDIARLWFYFALGLFILGINAKEAVRVFYD